MSDCRGQCSRPRRWFLRRIADESNCGDQFKSRCKIRRMAQKAVRYSINRRLHRDHISACDIVLSRRDLHRQVGGGLCRRLGAHHAAAVHIHNAGQSLASHNPGRRGNSVCRIAYTPNLLVAGRGDVSRAGNRRNTGPRILVEHACLLGRRSRFTRWRIARC